MSLHLEEGDHSSASRSKSSRSRLSGSLKRIDETCSWIWRSDCQLDLRPMERLVEERNGQSSARKLSRTEHPNKIFEINSRSFWERVRIDPKSQNSGQIPHGWTGCICHVVSSSDEKVHLRRRTRRWINGDSVRKAKPASSQL